MAEVSGGIEVSHSSDFDDVALVKEIWVEEFLNLCFDDGTEGFEDDQETTGSMQRHFFYLIIDNKYLEFHYKWLEFHYKWLELHY